MILQELYRLAERENLVPDPDFEDKPVAWIIEVDRDGKLLGIVGTHEQVQGTGERKVRLVPHAFVVPRQRKKTSGDRAFFLCDKAEYVLGMDPDGERPAEKLAARARLFRVAVEECARQTHDPGATAVARLLAAIASSNVVPSLPEGCKSNDLFAFRFTPDGDSLVHQRPAVKQYWKGLRQQGVNPTAKRARCVVTGARIGEAPNVPQVKRVPGGSSSGVAVVSFNKAAFESYGLKGNDNAPISRGAAEACITALNRLVSPDPIIGGRHLPRRSFVITDDTVVCYWGAGAASDGFLDPLAFLVTGESPERVADAYRSIWRGTPVTLGDPGAFYALTLSGGQGRATVRDWFVSTVSDVAANLARHFADLYVAPIRTASKGHALPPQVPLKTLLAALAPPGRDNGAPPQLAAQFVNSALRGAPYPFAMLTRAIERTRAEISGLNGDGVDGWRARERQDARSAVIKAVLRRNTSLKEITPDMDPNNQNPGYLLGRLMAVIERLQQVALGDVNAGVVDRFFSSASATPKAVFTRLLRNARHHFRKAADEPKTTGTARWLDKQIDEIAARFDPAHNGFPAYLDLQQQGLFVLGYHQQRHWLWLPREERGDQGATVTPTTSTQGAGA